MQEPRNNINNSNNINVILNQNNYAIWTKAFRSFLDQKMVSCHLDFASCDAYRNKVYQFPTEKEERYFARKQIILDKPLVAGIVEVRINNAVTVAAVAKYDEKNRRDEIYALQEEAEFKSEIRSFEVDRSKANALWLKEETQIRGYFQVCIENSIWQDAQCLGDAFKIWAKLKVLTGQETGSHWINAVQSMFNIQMNDIETNSSFISRFQAAHKLVEDLGDEELKLSAKLQCAKIVSGIKRTTRSLALLQGLTQIEKAKANVDHLKAVFLEDDAELPRDDCCKLKILFCTMLEMPQATSR